MIRIFFSLFFSLSFLFTAIAPTVELVSQDFAEVIELHDSNNEEKKKSENQLEKDLFIHIYAHLNIQSKNILSNGLMKYDIIKYPKPHLNIISPPPEI